MNNVLSQESLIQQGITVLVCCYNSEARLEDTFRALTQQVTRGRFAIELLIIDNASTDNTLALATSLCAQPGLQWPCRALEERRSGKSNALALGFQQAAYRYVAIVDDDNWLAPDYLAIAWQLLEGNPLIGVVGGYGEPTWEEDPPAWFATYARDYATGPQGKTSGDITAAKRYVYGAGQVIRKAAWQQVLAAGFQSILTGRKGAKLSSGEDNEMCYAITLAGYKIWYDERLRFRHFIPARRLRWEHVLNLYAGNATSEAALSPYIYFLQNPAAVNQPLRRWVALRHSLDMVEYCLRYGWQGLRQGELLKKTSLNRVRLRYYWQASWKYLQKAWQRNAGYEEVRSFIKRLAASKAL